MIVEIEIAGATLTERKRNVHMGKFQARVDQPDRVEYKAYVKLLAQEAMAGRSPLQGPLFVDTTYYRIKPPSWPKKPSKGNPFPFWPWKKPDLDNFGKIIWDAVTGIVWVDDAQVVYEDNMKVFADVERVVFRASTIDEAPADLAQVLAGEYEVLIHDIPDQSTFGEGDAAESPRP